MILAFGATGQIGSELISLLAADGIPVRSVTRDPAHVPARRGLEWVKASDDVPPDRKPVRHGGPADRRDPRRCRRRNLLGQAPSIVQQGRIVSASGDGRIPFIDTRDIAAVAAGALTQSGHDGKKYALTGPEALSYADIARILSDGLSRPIAYHDLSLDDARERMARAGASSSAIDGSLALAAYQRAGGKTAIVHDTVREVLGQPPRSFAAFVADHAEFFKAG